MRTIDTPNGPVMFNGTDEEAKIFERTIAARHAFAMKYCTEQGWPTEPTELSFQQVIEIRSQEEWKTAGSN